jgi:transposase
VAFKKPRKLWSQLKKATRDRKVRHYAKQGLTPRQVAARYNKGSLGSQKAVRGHKGTPEHGLQEALRKSRKSGKYDEYLERKKPKIPEGLSEYDKALEEAVNLNTLRDAAYQSMHRLHDYVYYNDDTVRANVYGGVTAESGTVPGMDAAEATWTASADIEDIRSMASEQFRGNPWWYH